MPAEPASGVPPSSAGGLSVNGGHGGLGGSGGPGAPGGGPAAHEPTPGVLPAGQVRSMFDRIAHIYDPLNTAMTAGLHHRWRARAVDLAQVGPGSRVLDVATGTGDLAIELARRVSPGGEVVGSDFSESMLARARAKAERIEQHCVKPRFEWADALALPYPDDSFDAALSGFSVRNFADLGRGLTELARVVRPGGKVVILEMTTPTKPPLSLFFRLWFDRLVPALGRLTGAIAAPIARVRGSGTNGAIAEAYAYLPDSVKRFPAPAALAAELERAGLRDISYLLTAGGIIAIHVGVVPARGGGGGGGVPARGGGGGVPADGAAATERR